MAVRLMAKRDDLLSLLRPAIEAMDYVCWGVQYSAGAHRAFVRVLIDCPGGVTLDDCERVNKRVSLLLDVEDLIHMPYTLEISSPGIDRPLLEPPHYQLYLGHQVSIRCYAALFDRRKNFTGTLNGLDEDGVCLHVGDERITIPFNMIKRANLKTLA